MKSTGIVRCLDKLGRVVIPNEIRNILHLKPGDPIEITVHGRYIHLHKHEDGCVFCNTKNAKFIEYNGLKVCWPCARHLGHKSDC